MRQMALSIPTNKTFTEDPARPGTLLLAVPQPGSQPYVFSTASDGKKHQLSAMGFNFRFSRVVTSVSVIYTANAAHGTRGIGATLC